MATDTKEKALAKEQNDLVRVIPDEQQAAEFLSELTLLSRKHGIAIGTYEGHTGLWFMDSTDTEREYFLDEHDMMHFQDDEYEKD